MHGPLITILQAECRSRHEGEVPPPHELVWQDWVGPFLRLLAGARTDETIHPHLLREDGRTVHVI